MYVCLSVTVLLQIASFLFLDGIELFFDRQFSTWHSTKLFFFDFRFVTPKIYSPKFHCHKIAYKSACMPDRPDVFGPTRGDDQGPIFVAMATTFSLGAESNLLPACTTYFHIAFLHKLPEKKPAVSIFLENRKAISVYTAHGT